MKMFDFQPGDYSDRYRQDGFVHIREGVTPEFHEYLLQFVEKELEARMLDGFAIRGKKEQALFEFPDDVDYPGELFDAVAELCGLDRSRMVLSERHIQAYEANAAPEPIAHKDRYPSQVSVGLSITIPEDSRLVLYPADFREINPFSRAADLNRQLQPEDKPETVLPSAREVELADRERDIVIFPGSTTWHLRRRSARSVNVYFKLNDFGCDPLGEDPATAAVRERTVAAARVTDHAFDALIPVVSRRLDTVSRVHTRNDWQEVLQAQVYGEQPVGITESQWAALRAVDGDRSVGTVADTLSGGSDRERALRDIRYLAEIGALDLHEPDTTSS